MIPIEQIGSDHCTKFCEGSVVTFTLLDPNNRITNTTWTAHGGNASISPLGTSMDVDWDTPTNTASVGVEITLNTGEIITKSVCIEVIPAPLVDFEFLNTSSGDCGGNVQMVNLTTDANGSRIVSYNWVFDNGQQTIRSNDREPNVMLGSGVWTVALSAANECNCEGSFEMQIELNDPAELIECPTVVCQDQVESYTVQGSGQLNWTVDGGDIINGQGSDTITVSWNSPNDGFGLVEVEGDLGSCSGSSRSRIPIISSSINIDGDTELCTGDQYIFSLPRWPATEFVWQLHDGNGNLVTGPWGITTDQPNEIALNTNVLPPGNSFTLSCRYDNTLLKCGGQAEALLLTINERLEIQGNNVSCMAEQVTLTGLAASGNVWEVYLGNTQLITQNSNQLNFVPNAPGVYSIFLESNNYCRSLAHLLEVYDNPVAPPAAQVTGTFEQVCAGTPYTYHAGTPVDGNYHEWHIDPTDGNLQGGSLGNQTTVVFEPSTSSNPYLLQLRQVLKSTGCTSDWLDILINPVEVVTAIEPALIGQSNYCSSTTAAFSVDYVEGETYGWSFSNPEYGGVIIGQNSPAVTVMLNEVPDGLPPTVDLQLSIRKCGVEATIQPFTIHLNQLPTFTLSTASPTICADNEFTIDLMGSNIPTGTTLGNNDINIAFQYISNNVLTTFDQPFAMITNLGGGNFEIHNVTAPIVDQVTSMNIILEYDSSVFCAENGIETLTTTVDVDVSPQYTQRWGNIGACNIPDYDTFIEITNQTPGGLGVTYQWFRDGVPLPNQNSNRIDLNISVAGGEAGDYYCEIGFPNGNPSNCTVLTRAVTFTIDGVECGFPDPPECSANNADRVEITGLEWISCDQIRATFNQTGVAPSSINYSVNYQNWKIVSENLGVDVVLQVPPGSRPRTYTFRSSAVYPNCVYRDLETVDIHYQPDLQFTVDCPANPGAGYDVTIVDNSPVIPSYAASNTLTYTYELVNFNGGGPVTNASGNASFTGVPDGLYMARITIQGATGDPVCSLEKAVLLESPDPSFIMLDANDPNAGPITQSCTECPIALLPDNINPRHTYRWEFMNDAAHLATAPVIQLPAPAQTGRSYPVRLFVTDQYGCEATSLQQITIKKALIVGFYGGSGLYCADDNPVLSFTSFSGSIAASNPDPALSGYQWMLDTAPAPGFNTGATYTPTQSGQYWVQLRDTDLCLFNYEATNVTILPEPYFEVLLPDTACVGQPFTVDAVVDEDMVTQYQWVINGSAQGWQGLPVQPVTQTLQSAASINYALEVMTVDNCDYTTAPLMVNVLQPVDIGQITWMPEPNCNPYEVVLGVTNPQPGIYQWSNGAQNSTITVDRGGAYQLTYYPVNGSCPTIRDIWIPKDPSAYMWYFPSGCIEFCEQEHTNTNRYIPGFTAYVDGWDYSGNTGSQFGTGVPGAYGIDPLYNNGGFVELEVTSSGCDLTSDPLRVSINYNCDACPFEIQVENIIAVTEPYNFYEMDVVVHNTGSADYYLDFSMLNIGGIFDPSHVYIPASSSVAITPLRFIDDFGFPGGTGELYIEGFDGSATCFQQIDLDLPPFFRQGEGEGNKTVDDSAFAKASPNPASYSTTITYDLYQPDTTNHSLLHIFTADGIKVREQLLNSTKGDLELGLESLSSGSYVVTITSGNVRVQTHLIKK